MIPSTTNRLLVTEDWKKIYQSYRNADFKSYDFDTLRRTMITYLRENYPEDFNDFVDSSEYVALIDLIAYLGQNLSFRVDLNARENFLETAQRRESVLRLARLINYNAKRNMPSSGLLKIVSIQTTESVLDSNGINLANALIGWNDSTNNNWYDQFITVLNASLQATNPFGKPVSSGVIDGIATERYTFRSNEEGVPLYTFTKGINGTQMTFEIVSSNFDTTIYEEDPRPGNPLSFLYRNDNMGNGSSNTGFFVFMKQGTLSLSNFDIDNPVPNEVIGINANNINETDVWLWQLNTDGTYPDTPWTKVSSISGNNVIYNSISENNRKLYTVSTREDDQIDLNFADGSFGDLPKGSFSLFYRQSNGFTYSIKPEQLRNVTISINYTNQEGQSHQLKIFCSLQYTISTSSATETNAEIKLKAPQSYYSQNRMITAEDYNIVPLTAGTDILKVKAINRTSSGISKYYEMSDVTGKYSDVNIFGSDGLIYKTNRENTFEFYVTNKNDIKNKIKTNLNKIFGMKEFRSFYIENYDRPDLSSTNISWIKSTNTINQSTGYFSINGIPVPAGEYSSNNLKYGLVGALIKFSAPKKYQGTQLTQTYFLPNGKLTFVEDNTTSKYRWAKIVSIVGDGYNGGKGALTSGVGPVVLSSNIPSDAVAKELIPKFVTSLDADTETAIINLSMAKKNFGLSLDPLTATWFIISDTNINLTSPFNHLYQGDYSDTNMDASWMIAFVWSANRYVVRYRTTEFIFESDREVAFFVEPYKVNYDYINDLVIKDKITILGINPSPTTTAAYLKLDQDWQVDSAVIESDGYQEPKKIKISFYDKDDNGQFDNPDSFNDIVSPEHISVQTGFKDKFIFFELKSDGQRYNLTNSEQFFVCPTENDVPSEMLIDGQLFYFYSPSINVIKKWNLATSSFDLVTNYFARSGRAGLKFQYNHKAAENRRIDPSKTNIIDVYLLTRSYDTSFRNWLISNSTVSSEPLAPTSQGLSLSYAPILNATKSISDELIFHPCNYKILFGSTASPVLQATFKATRNIASAKSDNDLKTRILTAIEDFFSVENWDFGQTFYFSELATYVMNLMTPDITNFIIVPKQDNVFGSLYEIQCQGNEIFVSGAKIADIEIISSITSTEIKSLGNVVNSIGGQQ